jgi:hypothetical protein
MDSDRGTPDETLIKMHYNTNIRNPFSNPNYPGAGATFNWTFFDNSKVC